MFRLPGIGGIVSRSAYIPYVRITYLSCTHIRTYNLFTLFIRTYNFYGLFALYTNNFYLLRNFEENEPL